MKKTFDRATLLFVILGGFFIANAIIAEFIGIKIFQLESTLGFNPVDWRFFGQDVSLQYTAGVILWPVVFVMTDIINEYFGVRGVRILSFLTVGLIVYAFIIVFGAIALSPAKWWLSNYKSAGVDDMQVAFKAVFGQGQLIIVGSLVAFLVGQIVDVRVFHKIKSLTGEKKVWLRATGSTLISQFIDSFVVLFIAFYLGPRLTNSGGAPWAFSLFIAVGLNNYIYKFVLAIVLTPVIYAAHGLIDRFLGNELSKRLKKQALIEN